jgi:hypothetical protein
MLFVHAYGDYNWERRMREIRTSGVTRGWRSRIARSGGHLPRKPETAETLEVAGLPETTLPPTLPKSDSRKKNWLVRRSRKGHQRRGASVVATA